jgi:hypothetical protein
MGSKNGSKSPNYVRMVFGVGFWLRKANAKMGISKSISNFPNIIKI